MLRYYGILFGISHQIDVMNMGLSTNETTNTVYAAIVYAY